MMRVTPLREGLTRKKRNEKATIKKPKFEEIWAMFDELYIAKSVQRENRKRLSPDCCKKYFTKARQRNLDEVERVRGCQTYRPSRHKSAHFGQQNARAT